jgi:YidC/Oxa1 family membrane protein insertase
MPNTRMLLWIALAAILYLNYDAWMRDYGAAAVSAPAPTAASSAGSARRPASAAAPTLGETVPTAAAPAPIAATTAHAEPFGRLRRCRRYRAAGAADTCAGRNGSSNDDVGTDRCARYPDQPEGRRTGPGGPAAVSAAQGRARRAGAPVQPGQREYDLYVLQSGLSGDSGLAAPTHLVTWSARSRHSRCLRRNGELRVPLTWTDGSGLTVTKTFVFRRGSYAIGSDVRDPQ